MIEQRDLIEAIWGDDPGLRFVCTDKNYSGKFFETNQEAVEWAASEIRKERQVFFVPKLLKPGSEKRVADNVMSSRVFVLDIDCGDGKPYATKEDAVRAVFKFSEDTGLPLPAIVDSGKGLHLYFILREAIDGGTWATNAGQIEAICKAQNLKVDESVTKDRARIMRYPGSSNRKDPEHPKECKLLLPQDKLIDHAEFQAILTKIAPAKPNEKASEFNEPFLAGFNENKADPKQAREIFDLCLPFLSIERCNDRKGWIDCGILTRNVLGDDGLPIWVEWSKQSNLYKPGDCEERWRGFNDDRPDGERLGIGSLIEWAKEDGGEKFAEVWERYNAERRIHNRYPLTDAGNAKRLVDTYGDIVRFDRSRRLWYVNNGRFWVENAWADVLELAKKVIESMRSDVARMSAGDDESKKKRDDLLKAINRFDMHPRLEAMVKAAATTPDISATNEDFDSDPNLLNVSNGVLDLRTGLLTPHGSGMFTYCLDVAYDPAAKCKRFEAFMDDTTCGDKLLLGYLQRAIGYTLTGHTSEEKFFLASGKGQNGKGSLFEAVEVLLGPLSTPIRTSALMQHRLSSHSSHNDDIASLEGKRLILMTEVGRGRQYDLELLKQLTGGGRLRASRKHQASFEFTQRGKIWIEANDQPDIPVIDDAIKRRLRVVPFAANIPDEQRDDTLKPYLKTPEAQAAILTWAVEGSKEWYRNGLGSCDAVTSATAAYFADQDIAANFIFERCERGESFKSQAVRVYEEFDLYCKSIGVPSWKPQHLATELRRLKFTPGRTKAARFWNGFRLRSADEIYREALAAVR